jgi:hypothetical protein
VETLFLSDFNEYFRPFTPKPTAILSPWNYWNRKVDLMDFEEAVNGQDNDETSSLFQSFIKDRSLLMAKILRPRCLEGQVGERRWRFLKFAEDVRPPYNGMYKP